MKKLLVLVAVFTTVLLSNANAQQGNGNFDPAQMAQRYKERVKPQLIEKVKLTDAQAEKVCDIQLASRQQMRGLRDLSEDDRKKKIDEIQADNNKQYKAIPLTDDQIKAVNDFMDEMRKQMQQQRQNGGGGNN
jgi:Spy/CpxP family protein refolding chaperone